MKNPLIYRRWEMPFFVKAFFWLFMALPIISAALPLYDMLSREQIDWAGVSVLLIMILFSGFLYYLAVRYNRRISKTIVWLAEQLQMQAYVSRGMMPGFIFWPEVSGQYAGEFVLVRFLHRSRHRFTELILPKKLVDERNLTDFDTAKKNQKLPKDSELRQNETAYIFRLRGCIVEKPVAEHVLLAFSILTRS